MLWEHDKDATIIQFASKKPQLSDYEAQFDFYSSIANKIEQEERISLVCCVKYVMTLLSQKKSKNETILKIFNQNSKPL